MCGGTVELEVGTWDGWTGGSPDFTDILFRLFEPPIVILTGGDMAGDLVCKRKELHL